MDEPLQPLAPPAFLQYLEVGKVISVVFAVLFVIWAIYTLVSAYHWLRYGHSSAVAIPALIVHVVMSWLLASYAVSGVIG